MIMKTERISILSCFFILLLSLFLFGGTACTGNEHAERIDKVDSLQKRLKALEERMERLDTGRVFRIMKRSKKELELFRTHFKKDSMGQELFDVLDGYKRTRKAFEGYGRKFRHLNKELDKSRGQLEDLKADLKKGRLSKKKAKGYIEDEKKILQKLERSLGKLEKRTKAVFENYKGRSEKLREHLSLPDSVQWPEEKQ